MYKTGGLEPDDAEEQIIRLGGSDYVVGTKFRTMLRDSFINWGAFLEIYNKNISYVDILEQVIKLLDLKENENLRNVLIPVIQKIYHLPARVHIAIMMKQFMIYEPISIAIHGLFITFKRHFELVTETFIETRNKYIADHKLKVKSNNWKTLIKKWNDDNVSYNLDSSSVILLFLNPPKKLKSSIHYKIPGKEEVIEKLRKAVSEFHYSGYCPKVPHKRMLLLFTFPLKEFVDAINALDPNIVFPDYDKIQYKMMELFDKQPEKPKISEELKREDPPRNMLDAIQPPNDSYVLTSSIEKGIQAAKITLIKWYIDKILELRKNLLDYGKKYETYYINVAVIINEMNDMVKTEFSMFNPKGIL